jgi:hypothetical protein
MRTDGFVATIARSCVLAACALFVWAATPAAADDTIDEAALESRLATTAGGPGRRVLDAALAAYVSATHQGAVARTGLLTVIDYTRPSTEPRLWVLDLNRARVLYRELVAHGRRSGDNTTRFFSNAAGSLMTSLGLFVTDTSYVGRNGYSLRLRGLDSGVNDNAWDRAIVVHGAAYVSTAVAERLGRLGRSWGCPAVRADVARPLIDTIKGGTVVFAYGGRSAQADVPSPAP